MTTRHTTAGIAALIALALLAPPTQAVPISVEALDNATVQPAGPRSGGNGKAFFNIEGSAFTTFASYGVADFNFGPQPFQVVGLSAATLHLTQSNAAFSNGGSVLFSLDTRVPASDIQPGGTSPLNFDGADPGTATDEAQGDLVLMAMGNGVYDIVANGHVNSYPLFINPPNAAALMTRLNAGGNIRIVVGTAGSTVAATWAGHTNTTYVGPRLELEVQYDTGVPTVAGTWGRIKSAYR